MVMQAYTPEDVSKLHPESVIRIPTILKIYPVSRSTWEIGVKSGRYPKPIRLSERGIGWRLKDILKLIEDSQESAG